MTWPWELYIGCPVCKAGAGRACVDLADPKRKRERDAPHPERRMKTA